MVESDFDSWYAETRSRFAGALAVWCRDASLAADSLDEAFVRAIERWDRVAAMDAPDAWIWRTATNVARRKMRRASLERRLLRSRDAITSTSAPGPTGTDVDLVNALAQLTERQRTAIVLHHVADLPLKDVAVAMGVALGTASATVHQARSRLVSMLGSDTGESAVSIPTVEPEHG